MPACSWVCRPTAACMSNTAVPSTLGIEGSNSGGVHNMLALYFNYKFSGCCLCCYFFTYAAIDNYHPPEQLTFDLNGLSCLSLQIGEVFTVLQEAEGKVKALLVRYNHS